MFFKRQEPIYIINNNLDVITYVIKYETKNIKKVIISIYYYIYATTFTKYHIQYCIIIQSFYC